MYEFKALPGISTLFDAAPRIESDRLLDEEAQRRLDEEHMPKRGLGAVGEKIGGSFKSLIVSSGRIHAAAI